MRRDPVMSRVHSHLNLPDTDQRPINSGLPCRASNCEKGRFLHPEPCLQSVRRNQRPKPGVRGQHPMVRAAGGRPHLCTSRYSAVCSRRWRSWWCGWGWAGCAAQVHARPHHRRDRHLHHPRLRVPRRRPARHQLPPAAQHADEAHQRLRRPRPRDGPVPPRRGAALPFLQLRGFDAAGAAGLKAGSSTRDGRRFPAGRGAVTGQVCGAASRG